MVIPLGISLLKSFKICHQIQVLSNHLLMNVSQSRYVPNYAQIEVDRHSLPVLKFEKIYMLRFKLTIKISADRINRQGQCRRFLFNE